MKKCAEWGLSLALALAAASFVPALAEVEPGAGTNGSGGGAALQSVDGNEAMVQLVFHAMTSPATATITPQNLTEKGEIAGLAAPQRTVSLPAGVETVLLLPVQVTAGKENHLQFQIQLLWPDGTGSAMSYYLLVNLDPAREPRLVGNVLEYTAQQVKP